MGKLVVIEGLDGSGKATQTKLVAESLCAAGMPVKQVTFPDYASDSSALVKMYLGGVFGDGPDAVNPFAASAFYSVDRYASFKTSWEAFYTTGGVVLADRYATSNAIHQCAKLPRQQWQAFIDWLEDFEYEKLGIPKPDVVVYLDVEPDVSQKLMLKRYGDESKKDIHEKDVGYLKKCRETAAWCAGALDWKTLVCSHHGEMMDVNTITKSLVEIIREAL